MNCYRHTDFVSVYTCAKCGVGMCNECYSKGSAYTWNGRMVCHNCDLSFLDDDRAVYAVKKHIFNKEKWKKIICSIIWLLAIIVSLPAKVIPEYALFSGLPVALVNFVVAITPVVAFFSEFKSLCSNYKMRSFSFMQFCLLLPFIIVYFLAVFLFLFFFALTLWSISAAALPIVCAIWYYIESKRFRKQTINIQNLERSVYSRQ